MIVKIIQKNCIFCPYYIHLSNPKPEKWWMSKLPNFSSSTDQQLIYNFTTTMATASLSFFHLLHPSKLSSTHAHLFPQITLRIPLFTRYKTLKSKPLTRIAFALTDSPKSLNPDPQILLKQLAV